MPETKPTPQTIPDLHFRAYRAAQTLRARSKALNREHADRIRKLENFMRRISVEAGTTGCITGTDALSLSPDLEKLIANPTHGL